MQLRTRRVLGGSACACARERQRQSVATREANEIGLVHTRGRNTSSGTSLQRSMIIFCTGHRCDPIASARWLKEVFSSVYVQTLNAALLGARDMHGRFVLRKHRMGVKKQEYDCFLGFPPARELTGRQARQNLQPRSKKCAKSEGCRARSVSTPSGGLWRTCANAGMTKDTGPEAEVVGLIPNLEHTKGHEAKRGWSVSCTIE